MIEKTHNGNGNLFINPQDVHLFGYYFQNLAHNLLIDLKMTKIKKEKFEDLKIQLLKKLAYISYSASDSDSDQFSSDFKRLTGKVVNTFILRNISTNKVMKLEPDYSFSEGYYITFELLLRTLELSDYELSLPFHSIDAFEKQLHIDHSMEILSSYNLHPATVNP